MNLEFQNELENNLAASSTNSRRVWAQFIIAEDISIKDLSNLLFKDKKIAMRFAWLLTEIAEINPPNLYTELPYLWELSGQIQTFNFKESFANYWLIAGLPLENEGEAINFLFGWLQSSSVNVTIKGRAMFVLQKLTEKYPDLIPELLNSIEAEKEKHTLDFGKRANKVIQSFKKNN